MTDLVVIALMRYSAATFVVAGCVLALKMVLDHLAAMRVTSGEVAKLRQETLDAVGHLRAMHDAQDRKIDADHERLVAVDNRTKR